MKRHFGTIVFYLPEAGRGYLRLANTLEEFYFRREHLIPEIVKKGDWVSFVLQSDRTGFYAVDVRLAKLA